jgi:hypothetical protein
MPLALGTRADELRKRPGDVRLEGRVEAVLSGVNDAVEADDFADLRCRPAPATVSRSLADFVPRFEPGGARLIEDAVVIRFERDVLVVPEKEGERPVQRIDAGAIPHVAIRPHAIPQTAL